MAGRRTLTRRRIVAGVIVVLAAIAGLLVYDWQQRTAFPPDGRLVTFFQQAALTGPAGSLQAPSPYAAPVRLWLPPPAARDPALPDVAPVVGDLDGALPVFAALTGLDVSRVDKRETANLVIEFQFDGTGPTLTVSRRLDRATTSHTLVAIDLAGLAEEHDPNCQNRKEGCITDQDIRDPLRRLVFAGVVQALGLAGMPGDAPSVLGDMAWPTGYDLGALALLYHPDVRRRSGPIDMLDGARRVTENWPDYDRTDDFLASYGVARP